MIIDFFIKSRMHRISCILLFMAMLFRCRRMLRGLDENSFENE